MSWSTLDADDVPNTTEVADAISTGALRQTAPLLPDGHDVYTRTEYEARIRHVNMDGSGIAGTDVMTQGEMEAWRELEPPTPLDFDGRQHLASLPTRVVDLSWDNDLRSQAKVLEWLNNASTWVQIAAPTAGATTYRHGSNGPRAGINEYRVRWNDRPVWAYTVVSIQI